MARSGAAMMRENVDFTDLWTAFAGEDQRFRRILVRVFIAVAVIGLIVPWLPVREQTVAKKVQVMTRLAKVMTEKKPPPPPPKEEPSGVKTRDKDGGGIEKPTTQSAAEKAAAIKRKVAKKGVLAFRKELKMLRETSVLQSLTQSQVIAMAAPESATRSDTDKLATRALRVGGGEQIQVPGKGLSGGVSLADRQATKVEWVGANEGRGGGAGLGAKAGKKGRSAEEIDWVMQRAYGSLQLLFIRELRIHPDKRGKIAVRLTIAANGEVVDCKIESSELELPEFERKVIVKIKSLDFGAKDVDTVQLIYPLIFMPPSG